MNEELEELLAIIYNAYEGQVSYATDLWLKEEKHTPEEEYVILRNRDGLLCYFKSLLEEVKDTYLKDILALKKLETIGSFKEHLKHEKVIRQNFILSEDV